MVVQAGTPFKPQHTYTAAQMAVVKAKAERTPVIPTPPARPYTPFRCNMTAFLATPSLLKGDTHAMCALAHQKLLL